MRAEMGVVWTQALAIPAPLHDISTSLSQFRAQISLQREGALLGMAQQSQHMAWVSGWVETTGVGLNSSVILCSKHSHFSSEEHCSHSIVQQHDCTFRNINHVEELRWKKILSK